MAVIPTRQAEGALAARLRERPDGIVWTFLCLHLAAWTLLPSLVNPNLPLDVIEGLAWGREWQLGYAKHPPLSPWLMEVFARLGGGSDLPLYLLSQLCVVVAFWAVWRVAREMFGPTRGALTVLLLEGVYYHNFTSPEFNANVVLLPFWALTVWSLYRALRTGRGLDWVLCGVFAGLGILGKYYTALLLASLALYLLTSPRHRVQLIRPGAWFGLIACLAVLGPHIWWLVTAGFPSFTYALSRAGLGGGGAWSDHLVYPARFLVGQAAVLVPALAMLWALCGLRRQRIAPGGIASEDRRLLLFAGLGPLVISLLISAILGIKLRSMWGTPLFLFSGAMMVAWLVPAPDQRGMVRFARAWTGVFALALVAYLGMMTLRPLFSDDGKRTQFPGAAMAQVLTQAWHDRYDRPMPAVIGAAWPAGNLAWYSGERPGVYVDADPATAPWMSDAEIRRSGAVVVWQIKRPTAPDRLPARLAGLDGRFPRLKIESPLTLPWRTWGDMAPVSIGWAVIPPNDALDG